jgi:formylglycine-generating enzyme required for sulfatase activity
MTSCPFCNAEVQPSWKACPACGEKMPDKKQCPSCSKELDPSWKACPFCGDTLGNASPLLPTFQDSVIRFQDSVIRGVHWFWNGGLHQSPGDLITISLPRLPFHAKKSLEMVYIPAGTFMMGSPEDEKDRWSNEGPQHQVTLTQGFYMGRSQVTQAQWEVVMGSNPSCYSGKPNNPVEQVSWEDCQEYIKKLNQMGRGTFRLPTEAEWEYACRAGT